MNKFKSHALAAVLACAVGAITTNCTSGGGSVTSSSSGSGNGITGTLSMSTIFPTSVGPSWTPITTGSNPVTYDIIGVPSGPGQGVGISMTGVCSPGIATVLVNEGVLAPYSDVGQCDLNGNWTYSHFYSGVVNQLTKSLTVQGYDITNAIVTGASTPVHVYLSNVGPNPPTITVPATTPFNDPISNPPVANLTITGSSDPNVAYITVAFTAGPPGTTKIIPSAGSWSYDANLSAGGSLKYFFYSFDAAGNPSTTDIEQEIDYNALSLVFSVSSGGHIIDSGAGHSLYELESSMGGNVPDGVADPFSLMNLYTGLNDIINILRGP